MSYVVLISTLLLLQYTYFTMRAGMARGKENIKAPAMSGDQYFERCLRVQLNTLEQIAATLPAMWICAVYFRPDVAAVCGCVFFIGRFIYSAEYLKDPATRAPGMIIGLIANLVLMGCCFYAAISALI